MKFEGSNENNRAPCVSGVVGVDAVGVLVFSSSYFSLDQSFFLNVFYFLDGDWRRGKSMGFEEIITWFDDFYKSVVIE